MDEALALIRSRPSNTAEPDPARMRPERVLRMVDLPAPFAPMSATTSPFATRNETPRTATMAP